MNTFKVTTANSRSYIELLEIDIFDGRFGISMSNSKVKMPIINAGPALECVNRGICPFSLQNYKTSGFPRCYAQDGEIRWGTVRRSREGNKDFLQFVMRNKVELLRPFVMAVISAIREQRPFTPWVRINEAGDLDASNIEFFELLQYYGRTYGISLYGYSKSDYKLYEKLVEYGATILRSETDFVMVSSKGEAETKGLRLCPGICGPCVWCMEFDKNSKPIAIIGH